MDLSALDHVLAAAAAAAAGFINAVAGGGTLVSYPTLVALGVPAINANVTNAVALCPGYIGGSYAQRDDLRALGPLSKALVAPAAAGGLVGSVLLVNSSDRLFDAIVPFLILGACALLAFQDRIKSVIRAHTNPAGTGSEGPSPLLLASVFLASIYGGYFGAGLGIIVLAVLGLGLNTTFQRVNASKQFVSAITNLLAAAFFVWSGKVAWSLVAAMAPASLVGGHIGGRAVSRIPATPLRVAVILLGIAVAIRAWL